MVQVTRTYKHREIHAQEGGTMNTFTAYGRKIRQQIAGRYYRISIKQRILFSFIVLITLSIGAMGSFSYWIAAQEIEDNAYAGSRETVSKTAQLLDSRLNDVALSVQSLMLSDAYRKMMLDVFSHDVSNYYVHLSDLQYVLSTGNVQSADHRKRADRYPDWRFLFHYADPGAGQLVLRLGII